MKLENWFEDEEEERFVKKIIEGMYNTSELVETLMGSYKNTGPILPDFDSENVQNSYANFTCIDCGEEKETSGDCECGSPVEPIYKEIFEWYLIDSWLHGHLESLGEPVLEACNLYFWGRTCTGQAIELDGTIQKISRKLK